MHTVVLFHELGLFYNSIQISDYLSNKKSLVDKLVTSFAYMIT